MEVLNIPVFLRRHQPKGGMCMSCKKSKQDCSELDFATMPIIGINGNAKIVRCTEYERSNAEFRPQDEAQLRTVEPGTPG